MWDERYSESGYAYGTEPNDFLRAEYTRIAPGGRVLCLAEGQGRNAVFLARQGYAVTALDQSPVGLQRAEELARTHGVNIETVTADLADYDLGHGWDGIVSIFGHTPPPIRKRIHEAIPLALKEGGAYILEAYTPRQLDMPGKGGPPAAQREFFMSLDVLRRELPALDFVIGREVEREVNEGSCHQGLSSVVQLVAVKS
ncbi:class I SAM-dependent methyltransferase [Ruficoccus amylovorans]|uniref:Class I SAM-dependent methyltransferase n=1 Tax=Ruficoccus amylovorans TaxID=1804625 RepID=A0A842HKW1_9BACT|nr:class I SAM-dependent methyltransferase [Ruficoccus amylovorans]MBC2595781.1 class I SAM-dependent methyltransferase [Ruficoccus amylovorans]